MCLFVLRVSVVYEPTSQMQQHFFVKKESLFRINPDKKWLCVFLPRIGGSYVPLLLCVEEEARL